MTVYCCGAQRVPATDLEVHADRLVARCPSCSSPRSWRRSARSLRSWIGAGARVVVERDGLDALGRVTSKVWQ